MNTPAVKAPNKRAIHFSGYARTIVSVGDACACRPDGEFGKTRLVTGDRFKITCRACLRVMA